MNPSSNEELAAKLHKLIADAEALLRDSAGGAGETLRRACTQLRIAREELADKTRKLELAAQTHPRCAPNATAIVAFIAGLSVRSR